MITQMAMPVPYNYQLIIRNGNDQYIVDPLEGVQVTRGIDGIPSKMSFKVMTDGVLQFEEGNAVQFKLNDDIVFVGNVFEKSRDKSGVISVVAYDQLRYLKNKDCYVYGGITATDLIKMIATDFGLQVGELDNTQYVIPSTPMRVEKNKTLVDIIMYALEQTVINTPKHDLYHLYDDKGKLMLKSLESMKTDIFIDDDVMENIDYKTSIDKDTYNQVKIVRNVPDGDSKKLVTTAILKDDENIKKWGRLQYLMMPDDKVTNAVDRAKRIISLKNRKTREIRLKNVIGDIRVRGGTLVYLKKNLGDIEINNYVMVESVTHTFKHGYHSMDLDVYYQGDLAKYEVAKDEDAKAVEQIKAAEQKKSQYSGGNAVAGVNPNQVDYGFQANEGMVSQYGEVGCVDVAVKTGSYYNKDLKELADRGVTDVDTLESSLKAKGYKVESFNGYANKGDLLIYGNNDHVIIADGAGGGFGNSSSRGHAMRYGDVNYAWGNGSAPTKIIRMR